MFTGIIKSVAEVKQSEKRGGSLILTIVRPSGWKINAGDSIATNGVCLTVKDLTETEYRTELMQESLLKTTFGEEVPKQVNLEQALTMSDRLDGHMVTGHVDAVGAITDVTKHGHSRVYTIAFPSAYAHLVALKGSIAIDGISLTVSSVKKNEFSVALVEYTLTHTTLGQKKRGMGVNLEFDIMAKYIARSLEEYSIKKSKKKRT